MLEKPDIQEEKIVACLQEEYGLLGIQVTFLPLGADPHAAVYRAITAEGTAYFVKLRWGVFDETVVTLPKFLRDQGIGQIIAPLPTKTGQLWANLTPFTLILYPFLEGHNGYEQDMSEYHWKTFGAALKNVHTALLPPALKQLIPQEIYSAQWRDIVKTFLERFETEVFAYPAAAKLAAFLHLKREEVHALVARTEQLAQTLQAQPTEFVLCHSDVHAGNILIEAQDTLYIVDWDNPILAPKERDLMFAGGAQGFTGHTPQEEETLFYEGYGQTQVTPVALAYYRYERIIDDLAVYCQQVFLTDEGGEDREQALHYVASNFLPNGTLERAYSADKP